eukprot:TRINITY_DN250_c0_g1_i1.p1 TRINITY_DN250_c0_g1~~TRINITY_DN250_c0_g1_i1.p1  ORF type:complete len:521 (+),score=122.13 TRINITY_DN250_c0_g1_i1:46-1563(+)
MDTLLNRHISLVSNGSVRYEGTLFAIDQQTHSVALSRVISFGTENRPTDNPVEPKSEVFEYIIFKAEDIKEVTVIEERPLNINNMDTLLNRHISLVSNGSVRYEGTLFAIDQQTHSVALSRVISFGTENRPTDNPVEPKSEVFEYIIFKAEDIKEVTVIEDKTPRNPMMDQWGGYGYNQMMYMQYMQNPYYYHYMQQMHNAGADPSNPNLGYNYMQGMNPQMPPQMNPHAMNPHAMNPHAMNPQMPPQAAVPQSNSPGEKTSPAPASVQQSKKLSVPQTENMEVKKSAEIVSENKKKATPQKRPSKSPVQQRKSPNPRPNKQTNSRARNNNMRNQSNSPRGRNQRSNNPSNSNNRNRGNRNNRGRGRGRRGRGRRNYNQRLPNLKPIEVNGEYDTQEWNEQFDKEKLYEEFKETHGEQIEQAYDPSKSMFDTLSCETFEKLNRDDSSRPRYQNNDKETFGIIDDNRNRNRRYRGNNRNRNNNHNRRNNRGNRRYQKVNKNPQASS